MKHIAAGKQRGEFQILCATRGAQSATMTLRPGAASDDQPSNEHPRYEQWLFVISGTGEAKIGRKRSSLQTVKLSKNSLLLIEKGELHQIRNTGRSSLRTINFYVPPAYDAQGEPK